MSELLYDPAKPWLGGAYPQGDSNTIMPDVWGYLVVKYGIKTMLDIGCGFGHAMEWFNGVGVHVRGIEGWSEAVRRSKIPSHVIEHDFTTGPCQVNENFDLAWCSEFLEHVESRYLPHVMEAFRWCRLVCITHGEPGQNGWHHVNCQDSTWWVNVFHEHGFAHLNLETELLRATDRWKAAWGRRTLMLFQRNWP